MFLDKVVSFSMEGESLYVEAIVDEFKLVRSQTWYEPAEYGPATCWIRMDLDEDDPHQFKDEGEVCEFLDGLDPDWQPVEEY